MCVCCESEAAMRTRRREVYIRSSISPADNFSSMLTGLIMFPGLLAMIALPFSPGRRPNLLCLCLRCSWATMVLKLARPGQDHPWQ